MPTRVLNASGRSAEFAFRGTALGSKPTVPSSVQVSVMSYPMIARELNHLAAAIRRGIIQEGVAVVASDSVFGRE